MPFFCPILAGAALGDRLRAGLAAAAGILFAGLVAAFATQGGSHPGLIAPIGASAVLVFAVPASPLAQPWSVIGGNVVSATVGIVVVLLIPYPVWAAPVAVGGAIVAMSLGRCLHPPGGAVALGVALAGGGHTDWVFPVLPVAIDSALLVAAGLVIHRLTGHPYPHRAAPVPPSSAFVAEDVDAALADMHETFDIAREDLDALLARAAHHASLRSDVRRGRSARSSPRR